MGSKNLSQISLNNQLYGQIFEAIPLGLILVTQDRRVFAWNKWMEAYTKISPAKAIGKTLTDLFPDTLNNRFVLAIDLVLAHGYPQIISAILNGFVIPFKTAKRSYLDLDLMQQDVEVLPFNYEKELMALVVIKDVSDKIHLKNALISMAARYEESSVVDVLTGLFNRRFLWKHLEKTLKTGFREKYNIVCCMIDLDFFKKINDNFGHNGGDEVLVSFTKIAKKIIRPSDYLIRYGGEEFILILDKISIKNAVKLANRIRTKLEKTMVHGTVKKKVTCSIGISYWSANDPMINAEKLVGQADLQLYKAKKMGRNRIYMDGKKV